ncbi:MAG: phosphatase PAP2 family protein [Cellvibrionaceae bacterium]
MKLKSIVSSFRAEYLLLMALALIFSGIWGFVELADEVIEGETHAVDQAILLAMRNPADPTDPIGPPWVEELGRDFTALGGVAVLAFIAVTAIGHTLLRRKARAALYLAVTVGGGILLSTLLKSGFDRPRPELVPHESLVYTASFPSGHSMMAAVVYLSIAALLIRLEPRAVLRFYVLAVAVLLTIAVGISRIYLGVHWPTDVLAGWAAGATWAMLCWLGARLLQRRGDMETEGAD